MFWLGSTWFGGSAVKPPAPRPVTVSLSYRRAPESAAALNNTAPPGPKQTVPDDGRTVAQKTAAKPAARSEQRSASLSRLQDVQAAGEGPAAEGGDPGGSATVGDAGGGSGGDAVREAVPRYSVNPLPRYPAAARRRGQQGTVVLSVHVDEQGRVSNLWLFESSGHRVLDTAAVEAVRDWLFEPGMQNGRNIAMWVNVPVRFALK
jgi:protein TonB